MNHDNFFANRGLTEDGSAWVTRALDPFHDYNTQLAGMPDHDTEPTAIQTLRRKITIEKPAGLPAGAKFDAHIFTLPMLETIEMREIGPLSAAHYYDQLTTGTSSFQAGTVNVQTVQTGNDSFPGGTAYGSFAVREAIGLSVNDNNGLSQKKIIGGGFEVHNDTAALSMGGSCMVYTQPQSNVLQLSNASVAGGTTHLALCHKGRAPPVNLTAAAQIPASRTWQAAEGCYVPFKLDISKGSEFKPKTVDVPVFVISDDVGSATTGGAIAALSTSGGLKYLGSGAAGTDGFHEAPIETTGAYFTGLPEDTVLTLDVLFLVEVAPTAANPALLSLVRPTAFYDPTALELYCRTVAAIPPGTPVRNNEAGNWWKSVKDVARQVMPYVGAVAPIVLAASGHPAAAGAVSAMNGARLTQFPSKQSKKRGKATPSRNQQGWAAAEASLNKSKRPSGHTGATAKEVANVLTNIFGAPQKLSRK
jgi:hypothetical protein